MVPDEEEDESEPMETGEANEPVEPDNWAVYIFPELATPLPEKDTFND